MRAVWTATLLGCRTGRSLCRASALWGALCFALAFVAGAPLGGCSSEEPPAPGTAPCTKGADCPEGYECIAQALRDDGLCFPLQTCRDREDQCDGRDEDCNGVADDVLWAGAPCDSGRQGACRPGVRTCELGFETCQPSVAPVAEVCDGQDNDCDGAADEDFHFATDDANCGGCGNACPAGTTCAFANCAETNCRDGEDNDEDGFADCEDAQCLGRPCGTPGDGRVCALVMPPPSDGGMEPDGGEPQPVPACVVP